MFNCGSSASRPLYLKPIAVALSCLLFPRLVWGAAQQMTVGGATLLARVLVSPQPKYPAFAVQAGITGPAVIHVSVSEKGNIVDIRVLQSPSPEITASIKEALSNWRFKPIEASDTVVVESKIIFYFEILDGQATVLTPKDQFYVGRWRKPAIDKSNQKEIAHVTGKR